MLPATGFFKNIDCPYYEIICDRPYCHFRHRKKNEESAEVSCSNEIPTYNPTPKSQLVNAKSHIPITYVPDLAVRKEPHKPRSTPSYGYSDQQPTYKPTPLSILSTGKVVSTDVPKQVDAISLRKRSPSINEEDDSSNIQFEDLGTESSMIDEIIDEFSVNDNQSSSETKVKTNRQDHKSKIKLSESKHSSKSKEDKKKHNGHNNESKNIKSHSNNKSNHKKDSKSDHKKESKRDHKHKSDNKKDRDEKHRKESKEKHKNDSKKKSESKEKPYKHKSSSSDKNKHQHSSSKAKDKSNEDKNKEKYKKKSHKSKDFKQEEKEVVLDKEMIKNQSSLLDDKYDYLNEQNEVYDNDSNNYLNDSDLEDDPMEECLKIFTEYKPTEPKICPDLIQPIHDTSINSDNLISKKRIAHDSAQNARQNVILNKVKTVPSAAQVMVNRLKLARQQYEEKQDVVAEISIHIKKRSNEEISPIENVKRLKTSNNVRTKLTTKNTNERVSHLTVPTSSCNLIDDIIGGKSNNLKRKIAPVQNVYSIQREKAKLNEIAKIRAQSILSKTVSQTTKHSKRVAHVPDVSVADTPEVIDAEKSKLPVNVRNNFLKLIFQECAKLYFSKEEAQQRAVDEEYKFYERCSAIVTYRNSAMLAINRLRKELQTRDNSGLGPIMPGECNDKQNISNFSGKKFYETIKRYILSDDELILHGFPREGSVPGKAIVKNQRRTSQVHTNEDERVCCRCSKHYKIDKEGFALYPEDCLYHPLKKRTLRGQSAYLCCKTSEETGCATSNTHVSENPCSNEEENEGYQVTMTPEWEDDPRSHQVFALDCEMCYTTKGLELTRVTIINTECKTVYESLVKPLNPIIDYNTRFSGITEEQMERTATSILQVQANILHLCNSKTILIGHSLESDLKALKIIHSSVIDTSVLFPHKFGLPHKRALRDLASEYLKKIIQNNVSGHDSAEDALTCMELIKWKLKEEFKARGIKVS